MDSPTPTPDQPLTRKQRRELKRQEKLARREREHRSKQRGRAIAWIVVIAVVAGAVVGIIMLNGGSSNGGGTKTVDAITTDDWTKGSPEATVSLIEYSDLQCPACAAYYPIVTQINETYADDVYFAYRHFPLRSIHRNAQVAAQWAEAAGMQGKFFEFHDILFERQSEWSDEGNPAEKFKAFGSELELNVAQLETDASSSAVRDRVNRDYTSGTNAQVGATPTFFLNGEVIDTPSNFDGFKELIDAVLGAAAPAAENTNADANTNAAP